MCDVLGTQDHFHINLEDEVTRGAIVLKAGELLWPPPPPPSMAAAQKPASVAAQAAEPNPFGDTLKDSFLYSTGELQTVLFITTRLHACPLCSRKF